MSSMDEAVDKNLRICAQGALNETILARWKNAKLKILSNPNDTGYLLEAMKLVKEGECDLLMLEAIFLEMIEPRYHSELCDSGLVSIRAPVLNMDWAFPVDTKYQVELSSAMEELKVDGIDFFNILMTYSNPLPCEVYKESGSIDNSALSILQMALPSSILICCMVFGIILKLITKRKAYKNNCRSSGNNEHVFPLDKSHNNTNDLFDDSFKDVVLGVNKTDKVSLDALELKFRLKLISLNVQRLEKNVARYMEAEQCVKSYDDNWDDVKIL